MRPVGGVGSDSLALVCGFADVDRPEVAPPWSGGGKLIACRPVVIEDPAEPSPTLSNLTPVSPSHVWCFRTASGCLLYACAEPPTTPTCQVARPFASKLLLGAGPVSPRGPTG